MYNVPSLQQLFYGYTKSLSGAKRDSVLSKQSLYLLAQIERM